MPQASTRLYDPPQTLDMRILYSRLDRLMGIQRNPTFGAACRIHNQEVRAFLSYWKRRMHHLGGAADLLFGGE